MNKFLKEFKDRGYFYQCTDENELSSLLNKKKICYEDIFKSLKSSIFQKHVFICQINAWIKSNIYKKIVFDFFNLL